MNGNVTYLELDAAERQEQARQSHNQNEDWPEPVPLVRPLPPPEPFPIDALGEVLGNAAKGIADIVQCPLAIAACSVLAVASLAVQPHVDVVHPATGRRVPASLFLLSIAESGERKSASDNEASAPVREHETHAVEQYRIASRRWRDQHEAWEATRALVKKKAKGGWQDLDRMLQELGEEPKPPLKPYVIVSEPTFEGLAKLLSEGQPSLGLFSAEGGGFLGGHGMRDENRLRALTGLSELWDGSPLKRTRAGDGAMHLAGRRLSLHLMVQPSIAPLLLADDMAMGQGFLSRLLVCAPASTQGKRFQKEVQPWARPAINAYSSVISGLLAEKPRIVGDGALDPLPLTLSREAIAAWRDFADEMERGLADDGQSSGIRGLRNKVPEMALRIAGVLSGTEQAFELTIGAFQCGMELARFFLSEAKRLYEASMVSPEIVRGGKLLRWLIERDLAGEEITLRRIVNAGPASMRTVEQAAPALDILESHHFCRIERVKTGGRPTEIIRVSPLAHGF